jgi:hypothetical protein
MGWMGPVAHRGEERNAYKVLVGKLEGKTLLGRPKHRWKDNIQTDLQEMGWEGVDWINLAENREKWMAFVNMVMKFWLP